MELGLSTLVDLRDVNSRIACFQGTLSSYRKRNKKPGYRMTQTTRRQSVGRGKITGIYRSALFNAKYMPGDDFLSIVLK